MMSKSPPRGSPSRLRPAPIKIKSRNASGENVILTLVATGLSNKRVALQLNLHEKTAKHHMTRVLSKLKVRNRTEAAMALRDATDHHR